MLFYRTAFDYGYKGYAAAISILIFAAIMLVTAVQMWGQENGLITIKEEDKMRGKTKIKSSDCASDPSGRYNNRCIPIPLDDFNIL